ncbi:MAG: LamB/YcsF family protein [Acidobacteriota bacterium]|nr:LamB/YcsF family protein [Acidobacteriota bacterium]
MRIDLNSDIGESFGAWAMGQDAALAPLITSANVACGFHAGDPGVMRATVRLAHTHGVAVGAHPGFPDLGGFGRREMRCTPQEVEDLVVYQIGALAAVARTEGVRLQHVKAHGALYNMACRDEALAAAIARATATVDPDLILFGLPHSPLLQQGARLGLRVAAEVFADRAYSPDGSLVSRSRAGSVIEDEGVVVERALRMATAHSVAAIDGSVIQLEADTICVHGDTPGAARLAGAIRRALEGRGVHVAALGARQA